jgi:hypothetical protein
VNTLIALTILTMPLTPPPAAPAISCIDGHIVKSLSECPPISKHGVNQAAPVGGGGSNGGILGGLLGGIL